MEGDKSLNPQLLMWQPLVRWRSWHLSVEEPGGCRWGKSWLPSVVPARRDCEGWQTQCVHWLELLFLILHLLLGHASCRHLDRKGDTELAAPRPSMAQAQEKNDCDLNFAF